MTTLVKVLQVPVEELTNLSLEELEKQKAILSESKQKPAKLRLQIVEAQIKLKQPKKEKVTVENSKKPKAKAGAVKPKPTPKPKAKAEETEEAKPKAPVKPKAKAPVKPKPTVKPKAKAEEPKEELFTDVIAGDKVDYVKQTFKTVKDIQKQLLETPYMLHLFVDEQNFEKVTQFKVVYANNDVVVLVDMNQDVNSTMTLEVGKELNDGYIAHGKQKFEAHFYLKQPKAKAGKRGA